MRSVTPLSIFKIGDTVRLKSGGTLMTVTGHISATSQCSAKVRCSWFDNDGNAKSRRFHPDAVDHDDQVPPAAD